jgi:NADH-quinone oxidoreductase subunit H
MISYELAQGISLVSVVLLAGTLSLAEIGRQQAHLWYDRAPVLWIPDLRHLRVAETNRAPFDLPEAETELVAGFHTEYSSMKWAFYFLGEYANMMVVSGIAVTVFLGAWHGPVLPGPVWFPDQALALPLLLRVAPCHVPAASLRPAHGVRVEGAPAASLVNLIVTAAVLAL